MVIRKTNSIFDSVKELAFSRNPEKIFVRLRIFLYYDEMFYIMAKLLNTYTIFKGTV